jgi:hypothetical protein
MGMLTDTGPTRMTGASVALRVLAEARRDGLSDSEVLERSPVVLALTPPRVAPAAELPADATAVYMGGEARERPTVGTRTRSSARRCGCGSAGSRN